MIYLRRVVGNSMHPTIESGQLLVFRKTRHYKTGDIVLATAQGRQVVKRIQTIDNNLFLITGENQNSKTYTVNRLDIIAKLLVPKLKTKIV